VSCAQGDGVRILRSKPQLRMLRRHRRVGMGRNGADNVPTPPLHIPTHATHTSRCSMGSVGALSLTRSARANSATARQAAELGATPPAPKPPALAPTPSKTRASAVARNFLAAAKNSRPPECAAFPFRPAGMRRNVSTTHHRFAHDVLTSPRL
jgi:hypothetical protein